jgi:Protein of unknown function (DUF3572)
MRQNAPSPVSVGLDALLWLAGRPDDIAALLALSGIAPADLRSRSSEPGFLGFVLDFVLADEARARAFAEAHGFPPEAALRARAALPGGDAPDWT